MNTIQRELPPKKPYVAPVLCVHGDLRTLTQSGSGTPTEVKVFKFCGPLKTRAKC